jgi:hypothetical protein
MPHAFKASEIERRAQDGGRAARAWRWFSDRTVRASGAFRDWSWLRVGLHAGGAAAVVIVSRIDPNWAFAPWLLLLGGAWLLWSLRAALLKLIDQQR